MTKKVSELPFIDRSKYDHGVMVAVENQRVTIAVKPDASLDQALLFAAIESAGYHPIDIFTLAPNGQQQVYQP